MVVTASKPSSNQVVLMMTGSSVLDMTRLSVLSIAQNWKHLPHLMVTTDGTTSPQIIEKALSFWPGELTVRPWQYIADYHQSKQRGALVNYGDAHIFGKKLATILCYAEEFPVLWVDSDILFFNDFTPFIHQDVTGFACGGTEDFIGAYHEPVINYFKNDLYLKYKFNAGLLFASGKNIYEDFHLEQLINSLHPDYDFCTEQSIFAQIASESLGVIWSEEVVKNYNHDNQQNAPMPVTDVVARHYTSNVRHLFWRDGFFRL